MCPPIFPALTPEQERSAGRRQKRDRFAAALRALPHGNLFTVDPGPDQDVFRARLPTATGTGELLVASDGCCLDLVLGGEYQATWVEAIEEDPGFDGAVPRMLSALAESLLDPSRSRVRVSTRRVEVRCGESSEVRFGSRGRFGVYSCGMDVEEFSDPEE